MNTRASIGFILDDERKFAYFTTGGSPAILGAKALALAAWAETNLSEFTQLVAAAKVTHEWLGGKPTEVLANLRTGSIIGGDIHFSEWVYVFNFDAGQFLVYQGQPHEALLVASWRLGDLPTLAVFLADVESPGEPI